MGAARDDAWPLACQVNSLDLLETRGIEWNGMEWN